MAPILNYVLGGPPSRTVLLTIRHLNLDVELRPVDLLNKKEHLSEEFLKINPSHSVPFLKDGDFVIFESRAIAQYLVESQQPESQLLGRFPKKRALINQFLQFDQGKLFPAVAGLYIPVLRRYVTIVSDEMKQAIVDAVTTLNDYLKKGYWVAGENVSIADFSILSSLSTAVVSVYKIQNCSNSNYSSHLIL